MTTGHDSTVPSLPGSIDREALRGPARDFAAYCERELQRRRDAERDFDPALYDDAIQLVLNKLGAREGEGSE